MFRIAFSGSSARKIGSACALIVASVILMAAATGPDISTSAGGGAVSILATALDLPGPTGVVTDNLGNIYAAAPAAQYVFIDSAGAVTAYAGLGWGHFNNNDIEHTGIPANTATLYEPTGLSVDTGGDIYIANTTDNVIDCVVAKGNCGNKNDTVVGDIYVVAGVRQPCIPSLYPCNDGRYANAAYLNAPEGAVVAQNGDVYIADTGDDVVRCVTANGNGCNMPGSAGEHIFRYAGNYGQTCSPSTAACGDDGPATLALLNHATSVSINANNDVYIADSSDNRIRCVAAAANGCGITGSVGGDIYTVAGKGSPCTNKSSSWPACGDGGAATKAQLKSPHGVTVNTKTGDLYIADTGDNRVRCVAGGTASCGMSGTTAGFIYDFAGVAGQPAGYGGDGNPATTALLNAPAGVYYRGQGVFIADTGNQRIRCVAIVKSACGAGSVGSNIISTVMGGAPNNGPAGNGGDGYLAKAAMLAAPSEVAVDSSDNYYIADTANNRIRCVAIAANGCVAGSTQYSIYTVAGSGIVGYADNMPATTGTLSAPQGVVFDNVGGNLYIADTGNAVIREVSNGTISTLAGTSGGALVSPVSVAVDANENVYIADIKQQVVFIDSAGVLTVFAGELNSPCNDMPLPAPNCGDGGPATEAQLNAPSGVAVSATGDVYIADSGDNQVRCVMAAANGCGMTGAAGTIVTVAFTGKAESFAGDGGAATAAVRWQPKQVAFDTSGDLYIGGGHAYLVQEVNSAGIINTVAGNPLNGNWQTFGYTGDGGPATKATLDNDGLAVDNQGCLYIADIFNNVIREVPLETSCPPLK
ncbi:MAG TPA: hypothetical protein VF753_10515 [Terriglobales bacterium]